jgi:hypothetical protein
MKKLFLFMGIIALSNLLQAKNIEGKWQAIKGADYALVNSPVSHDKKYTKLHYPDKFGRIKLFPSEGDWSKYTKLRLKIYNPDKYARRTLILKIEDDKGSHSFGADCNIPNGSIHTFPLREVEIDVDLANLPKKLDAKKIKSLTFYYWSNPEAEFYINSIELFTKSESIEQANKKQKLELKSLYRRFQLINKKSPSAEIKNKIDAYSNRIAALLKAPQYSVNKQAEDIILQSKRYLTVLDILEADKKLSDQKEKALIFCNPPTEKIFLDTPYEGKTTYQVTSAGHERESFQIVVVPVQPLTDLKVSASPLINGKDPAQTICTENIKINPVGYVEVPYSFCFPSSRPGWWPDPLVKNQKIDLSERIQPYWITIYVPQNQHPGTYKGFLSIKQNDKLLKNFEYTLQVHNFSLPVRGELKTFITFGHNPKDTKQRREEYDMLLKHRINPITMYPRGPETVPAESDLQFCLDRGLNAVCLAYLYNHRNKDPFKFDKANFNELAKNISIKLKILDKYKCRDIGFINTSDELLFCDEKTAEYRLKELKKKCSFIKELFPNIELSAVGHRMPIERKFMDSWYLAPTVDTLPEKDISELHKENAEVNFYWVYEDPSFMLDLPGMAPRICSWQAFKYGARGIGYYSTYRPWALKCPSSKAPKGIFWSKEKINVYTYKSRGYAMDGNLLYPSPDNTLLTSIRLANIRDGIEDYEYLSILRKLTSSAKEELLDIPESIVSRIDGKYTKKYDTIESYRRKVASKIEELSKK